MKKLTNEIIAMMNDEVTRLREHFTQDSCEGYAEDVSMASEKLNLSEEDQMDIWAIIEDCMIIEFDKDKFLKEIEGLKRNG